MVCEPPPPPQTPTHPHTHTHNFSEVKGRPLTLAIHASNGIMSMLGANEGKEFFCKVSVPYVFECHMEPLRFVFKNGHQKHMTFV